MKKLYFLFIPFLIFTACEPTKSDTDVSISGRVVDNQSGDPIPDAFIEILSPETLRRTVSTNATGAFVFNGLEVEGTTDILIEAKKQDLIEYLKL